MAAVAVATKEDWVGERPEYWARTVFLYPPGSHRVTGRLLDYISKEHWLRVEDLLLNGYTIGFSASDEEVAPTVCEAVQALKIPVVASEDIGDGMVYISSARGKGVRK